MRQSVPESLVDENNRLGKIWVESGESVEAVVKEHASSEYKKYYYARMARKKRLREKGIIEN